MNGHKTLQIIQSNKKYFWELIKDPLLCLKLQFCSCHWCCHGENQQEMRQAGVLIVYFGDLVF